MAEGSIDDGDNGTWWRRRVQPAPAPVEAVVEQGSGGAASEKGNQWRGVRVWWKGGHLYMSR
jgi:hypothetical protein